MQKTVTYLIASLASTAFGNATGGIGESCYTDSYCKSFCCDNDGNYHVEGECILLEESDRCVKRKLDNNITLWLIIIAMIAATAFLGWKKKKEIEREKQRLLKLKIDSAKAEQERLANQKDPFAAILDKKPQSTRNSGTGPSMAAQYKGPMTPDQSQKRRVEASHEQSNPTANFG